MAEPVTAAHDLNPWGEKIDTLRRAAGLSWVDLWRQVGVESSQGRKWVRAQRRHVPGPDRVAKIAEVLGVDPDEIPVTPKPRQPTALMEAQQLREEVSALRETVDSLAGLIQAMRDDIRSLSELPRQRRRPE